MTGLEILLFGRVRGDIDPGRHTGGGEPDGARRRRGRAAGDARRLRADDDAILPFGPPWEQPVTATTAKPVATTTAPHSRGR